MSVEVITMWYNEAFLAPFFLKHYAWADRITLLFDKDTSDNTLEIARTYKNVKVVPFRFPDMMDDEFKCQLINKQYQRSTCDWVLSVDADEFAFYKRGDEFIYDLNGFLQDNSAYQLVNVDLYQIYKHKDDAPLDENLPAVPQRRHGDPDLTCAYNCLYIKPILVRSGLDLFWAPGCHAVDIQDRSASMTPEHLMGGHWSMADPIFAVERRVKNRRERQSKNNLRKRMTVQHHHVTVKSIMEEFAAHANDPQLY